MREVLVLTLAALFGCGGRLAAVEPEIEIDAGACRPACCVDRERWRCEGDAPDARAHHCSAVDVLPGPCDGWRCHVTNADGVLIMCEH